MQLQDSISTLPGIGPKAVKDLALFGVETIADLFMHVPFRYEDYSKISTIANIPIDEPITVIATLESISSRPVGKGGRLKLIEAVVSDSTGTLKVTWFNQTYLLKTLKPGMELSLSGIVDDQYGIALKNPRVEPRKQNQISTGRIVPVYPLRSSLTQGRLRKAIHAALESVEYIDDWIPKSWQEQAGIVDRAHAIAGIHFPNTPEENTRAITRLKFEELLEHQLLFAHVRSQIAKKTSVCCRCVCSVRHSIEITISFNERARAVRARNYG